MTKHLPRSGISNSLMPDYLSSQAANVYRAIELAENDLVLEVDTHRITLSNLNKTFWPPFHGQRGLTKRDHLLYLMGVSDFILPHLKDRPLTLTRYPEGIMEGRFYQKHWSQGLPEFVETAA